MSADIGQDLIRIQGQLAEGAVSTVGFGSTLLVIPDQTFTPSAPFRRYTNVREVESDTDLDATAKAWLESFFGARSRPPEIFVAGFDTGSGGLPSAGLSAAQAAIRADDRPAPYWIGVLSRSDADLVDAAAWVDADEWPHIFIGQTANGDALTPDYPSGLSDAQARIRKVFVYSAEADGRDLDADCIAFQASIGPEVVATGGHWVSNLRGSTLTDAQRQQARAHGFATLRTLFGAVGGSLPLREYEMRVVGGQNPLPLYRVVTVDYATDRMRVALASLAAGYIARGERFPGGSEGEALIRGEIGAALTAITGRGSSSWLSPTPKFDGRSYGLFLSWDPETRRFSGECLINIRDQVDRISLDAIFGSFLEVEA